jgi:hypothetical protein
MCWEKWLAKEEGCSSGDSSSEEASKVTPVRLEDNSGSGDGNPKSGNCNLKSGNYQPESGNCNPNSGNSNLSKESDRQGEELVQKDVNMVFMIPAEFRVPMEGVVEMALGAERAIF